MKELGEVFQKSTDLEISRFIKKKNGRKTNVGGVTHTYGSIFKDKDGEAAAIGPSEQALACHSCTVSVMGSQKAGYKWSELQCATRM